MRTTPWDWNDPTIRLGTGPETITTDTAGNVIAHVGGTASPVAASRVAWKSDSPKHIVAEEQPSPEAIRMFMRVVQSLNNSVSIGEHKEMVRVWKWLEELAQG